MTWSSLSTRISSLPLVICGPILRRTERREVSVWVAFRRAVTGLRLEIYDSPTPGPDESPVLLSPSTATTQLGDRLFVALVTANQQPGPGVFLLPDHIYGYNLILGSEGNATLDAPGILSAPGSTTGAIDSITYGGFRLPSFILPANDINRLKLAHGSCRKPHGGKTDALRALDAILTAHHANPTDRPQQLFLTGDQIYADDVADALLHMVVDAEAVLLGWSEPLPGNPPAADLQLGSRWFLVKKAGFTSGHAKNHLIRLGEFYAMYLLNWSDVLWDSDLPDFGDVFPGQPAHRGLPGYWSGKEESQKLPTRIYSAFLVERAKLVEFRRSLPFIRKTLANIPSYMVSDDHEVTDDWFLTRDWSEKNLAPGLTRRIIQNALAGFAVFQAWGNTPSEFDVGTSGAAVLQRLESIHANRGVQLNDWTDIGTALLPTLTVVSPFGRRLTGGFRWNFAIDFDAHRVIGLDTRTRRSFAGLKAPPCLVDGQDLSNQIPVGALPQMDLTVLLSAAPVIGHPLLEGLQRRLRELRLRKPHQVDYEFWLGRRDCLEALLDRLVAFERVLILSGDVHYAFSSSVDYWNKRTGSVVPAIYIQLCSSALSNESWGTNRIAGRLAPGPPPQSDFVGWNTSGRHVEVITTGLIDMSPIKARVTPSGTPPVWEISAGDKILTPGDWSYRVRFVRDDRNESDRGIPVSGPLPAQPQERAGYLHRRRTNWGAQRSVVGKDNLGSISFDWGAAKKIQHELWYAPSWEGSRLLFPYTRHIFSVDLPAITEVPG